ncbi:MAG: hypothetical protein WKF42_08960 [Solirubrobacteraceae bacterium]
MLELDVAFAAVRLLLERALTALKARRDADVLVGGVTPRDDATQSAEVLSQLSA